MNTLQILPATLEDLATLQTIGRKTFAETFAASNSEENLARYLAEGFSEEKLAAELKNESSAFYFAEEEDKILGYLKVNVGEAQNEPQDPDALEIERIYVLQEFHGKGVGLMLYEQALSIALEQNAPYIWLGVWEENPRAIRFYEKNGLVPFGTHLFKMGNEEQRDILMRLAF